MQRVENSGNPIFAHDMQEFRKQHNTSFYKDRGTEFSPPCFGRSFAFNAGASAGTMGATTSRIAARRG